MRESEKVYIESLAWIGWSMLEDRLREEILRCLEPLAGVPVEKWPKTRIKRWKGGDGKLFVLPLWDGPDEMFVLFFPKDGRIHIETFASRSKIEALSGLPWAELIGT